MIWFFYQSCRNQGGIKGLGGNCPHIFAELGAKSDPSKDLSCIIACPPQIFRSSAASVKTIIVQIDGLTEQGRVNSWPLSWIQKLETAIKRKRENKNCENAKCHSVTTREYRGGENNQLLFRALLFVTNHNTVRQSKLPSCAVIGWNWTKFLLCNSAPDSGKETEWS